MEALDGEVVEGTYANLAKKILRGYRVEGNSLIAGDARIEFERADVGFNLSLDGQRLGKTTDNYFLVYLTELFIYRDPRSLESIKRLARDLRTLQAIELQRTVSPVGRGFVIGKRKVEYSMRYFECSCPDWRYRRRLGGCKHIAALRLLDV